MKICIIILISILLVSCDNKSEIKQNALPDTSSASKLDSLPIFDTIINLNNEVKYKGKECRLKDSIAQKMLYSHFKSKGYYNSEDLTGAKELMHTDFVVDLNNIYLLELYESKSVNAIITYWITPPYASGHCFQLQKAIKKVRKCINSRTFFECCSVLLN